MRVIWSPLAEARAIEAVEYIAQERPQAAAAWLEKLLTRAAALDRFPKRGRTVEEIGLPAYRELLHAPYRVIYRGDPTRVVILTLRHSRISRRVAPRAWRQCMPTSIRIRSKICLDLSPVGQRSDSQAWASM